MLPAKSAIPDVLASLISLICANMSVIMLCSFLTKIWEGFLLPDAIASLMDMSLCHVLCQPGLIVLGYFPTKILEGFSLKRKLAL